MHQSVVEGKKEGRYINLLEINEFDVVDTSECCRRYMTGKWKQFSLFKEIQESDVKDTSDCFTRYITWEWRIHPSFEGETYV